MIGSLPEFGQGLPELGQGLPDIGYNLDLGSLNPVDYSLDLGSLPGYQNLDPSQLQAIPGEGDLNALRGNVENALFERSRSLLDPVYSEAEQRLNETYANRGMPVGGEERTEEFNRFEGNRSDAYNRAAQEAIIGGGQEMSRMLADAMGLRGQGLQEQMSLFGTGMQGRQQGLSELLANAGLGMQGRQQTLSERLAQLGAQTGARGQLFGEQMGTRGQLFGEQMGGRQQIYNELMGTRGAEFGQLPPSSALPVRRVRPVDSVGSPRQGWSILRRASTRGRAGGRGTWGSGLISSDQSSGCSDESTSWFHHQAPPEEDDGAGSATGEQAAPASAAAIEYVAVTSAAATAEPARAATQPLRWAEVTADATPR